jgi:hypothetical protein
MAIQRRKEATDHLIGLKWEYAKPDVYRVSNASGTAYGVDATKGRLHDLDSGKGLPRAFFAGDGNELVPVAEKAVVWGGVLAAAACAFAGTATSTEQWGNGKLSTDEIARLLDGGHWQVREIFPGNVFIEHPNQGTIFVAGVEAGAVSALAACGREPGQNDVVCAVVDPDAAHLTSIYAGDQWNVPGVAPRLDRVDMVFPEARMRADGTGLEPTQGTSGLALTELPAVVVKDIPSVFVGPVQEDDGTSGVRLETKGRVIEVQETEPTFWQKLGRLAAMMRGGGTALAAGPEETETPDAVPTVQAIAGMTGTALALTAEAPRPTEKETSAPTPTNTSTPTPESPSPTPLPPSPTRPPATRTPRPPSPTQPELPTATITPDGLVTVTMPTAEPETPTPQLPDCDQYNNGICVWAVCMLRPWGPIDQAGFLMANVEFARPAVAEGAAIRGRCP